MDITALSTPYQTSKLMNDVSVRVLSMSMDSMKTQGDGLQKILEASVNPNIGSNFDVSV